MHLTSINMKMKSIKYLVVALVFSLNSCEIGLNNCINGDGNQIEREITVDGEITNIEFKLSGDLLVSTGTTQKIIIEGDQNIVDLIERESTFRNNTYVIDDGDDCIDTDGLKIFIRLKSINKLALLGSGDIKSENTLKTGDEFFAELDGSGKIDLKLEDNDRMVVDLLGSGDIQIKGSTNILGVDFDGSGKVDIDIDDNTHTDVNVKGSGEIKLEGSTDNLEILLDGSADIKADDYKSQDCKVTLNGSGDIEVFAENSLEVNITGSGDVCYKGNPTVNVNIVGSGDLRECN